MVSFSNPDERTADGKGFVFNIAYEVNIRQNAPMEEDYVAYDYSAIDSLSAGNTFFCDEDQRTSEPVSFRVINGQTGEPESGVSMTFSCGDESCIIGKTGDDGVFDESLPVCNGGRMQLLKYDFETIFIKMSPNIDSPLQFFDVNFEPYRDLVASMKKIKVNKISDEMWIPSFNDPVYLDDNEYAIVQLERIEDYSPAYIERDDFSTYAFVNGTLKDGEIRLLPGVYEGSIQGILEEEIRIHPEERCYDAGMFGEEECVMVPENIVSIEKYSGIGAIFSDETGYLVIDKTGLNSAEEIQFMELFVDIPGISEYSRVIEDLQGMGSIKEFSMTSRNRLNPIFIGDLNAGSADADNE